MRAGGPDVDTQGEGCKDEGEARKMDRPCRDLFHVQVLSFRIESVVMGAVYP
jgi:hypothetical protein